MMMILYLFNHTLLTDYGVLGFWGFGVLGLAST
jgi:hypothetical protein